MLWFLKKKENDPDREALERFHTDFGLLQQRRFSAVDADSHSCRVKRGALSLELHKKNVFAWVPADLYQYRDFSLEATVSFDRENGHSAGGFIFRFINNENFYYFLVSNAGAFRCDVLFNGHPLRLIEWTPTPLLIGDRHEVRLIAHGSQLSFYVDQEWIGEIDDDKLLSGRIGVAGQNFNEEDRAEIRFHRLTIESRPVRVEKEYWRWARYVPAEPGARVALGRTFSAMGNYAAAAVELKKALKHDPTNEEALFLFAVCAVNLKLHDQALAALDRLLGQNPGHGQAVVEKANALYLANEFLKARDFIRVNIDRFADAATLWNLLGNCEHALGNWEKAAEAYREAGLREPEMPLYFANRARMLEKCGRPEEALADYLKAARLLFRQEAYDDLSLIMTRLTALAPESDEALGFEAKMLFHENKRTEAKPILEKLIQGGATDSALLYLSGLIAVDEGRREDAAGLFARAAEIEPGYALYWWRLAECERLLGRDYEKELEKARQLAPDDPWVNNLAGLERLDRGDERAALASFAKARAGAPRDIDILINYSDVLHRTGKKEDALALVEEELEINPNAHLYNHKGNLAVREGDYRRAAAEYEKAIKAAPDHPLYMENCAAACLEVDEITRAEELLLKLLDGRPTASVYNLLGNLCVVRTEYLRADYCYTEGLRLEPGNRDLVLNLASLALERSQYDKAKELIEAALLGRPTEGRTEERALTLQKKLRDKFETQYRCDGCGREWWVRRDVESSEGGKIRGEPPPESPAGQCPACGRIWCVGCARAHLKDNRFVCAGCGEFLKLQDHRLRRLVLEYLNRAEPSSFSPQRH
ncbi:MAG: tetratricopeptide repeat protein [Spirochaetales bacterium]|nr:tetratricopeptide repeat protein [Spirochaetales bacterium]